MHQRKATTTFANADDRLAPLMGRSGTIFAHRAFSLARRPADYQIRLP